MRHLIAVVAVLVASGALAVSVYAMRRGASEAGALSGVESRAELLRTRLTDLDKKLNKAEGTVANLADRVNELDELSRGFLTLSQKVPSDNKLRAEIDGVLEEKLKKVKWTPQTKVNFEPKSDKDKKFASLHGAVCGAAGVKGETRDALLALMLEQREKLNDVYRDAARRKLDRGTRDRRLADMKRQFDSVMKWKLGTAGFDRYVNWRKNVKDAYMKAFLAP